MCCAADTIPDSQYQCMIPVLRVVQEPAMQQSGLRARLHSATFEVNNPRWTQSQEESVKTESTFAPPQYIRKYNMDIAQKEVQFYKVEGVRHVLSYTWHTDAYMLFQSFYKCPECGQQVKMQI